VAFYLSDDRKVTDPVEDGHFGETALDGDGLDREKRVAELLRALDAGDRAGVLRWQFSGLPGGLAVQSRTRAV
jgi:hypothetical protein